MTTSPWLFLILGILCGILLFSFLFFYFRNFILMKQKLLTTESELSKTQEAERIHSAAILDLRTQMELAKAVDPLTGLVTQQLFEDRLQQVLNQSKRHHLIFAVLFLNLNEFKMITSALGLDVGDYILKETARRLQHSIRQLDTAARISGSDFALILPQLNKMETAAFVAQRLLDAISETYRVNDKEIFVSASIGIAAYPNDGDEARVLMKNAEMAMHQAIIQGHLGYQFYREAMQVESKREFILSVGLQNPAVYKDFLLYFQPIVNIEKRQIDGMKAILKWNHPDCGWLESKDFICLAENNGAITRVGEWVLRHACEQLQAWNAAGHTFFMMVEVSPRQLENPHFVYKMSMLLKEFHIEPASIMLCVAESAIHAKISANEKAILMLKELGIQIALTDFGTGNMVLWRLQGLQVDSVMIADLIVRNITLDAHTLSVIKMMMAIATTLNLRVIANGVDTKKQAQMLHDLGCILMAGQWVSHPLLAREFTPRMHEMILKNLSDYSFPPRSAGEG